MKPDWKLFRRNWAFGCAVIFFFLSLGSLGMSETALMRLFFPGVSLVSALGYGAHDGQTYVLIFLTCSLFYGLPAYFAVIIWREINRS